MKVIRFFRLKSGSFFYRIAVWEHLVQKIPEFSTKPRDRVIWLKNRRVFQQNPRLHLRAEEGGNGAGDVGAGDVGAEGLGKRHIRGGGRENGGEGLRSLNVVGKCGV